jgi:hypothetical protein
MRALAILVCLGATAAADPVPAWRDTLALDTLDADLAAIASGLGPAGAIDCAMYARIAPYVVRLPERIADVTSARDRLIEGVQADWRAQHVGELERRIDEVVGRLRRDQRCPAILGDDAALHAARAIVALAARPGRVAVARRGTTCADELRRGFANAAIRARAARPNALDELAASVADLEDVRAIADAPVFCWQPFGGRPRINGAQLGDL